MGLHFYNGLNIFLSYNCILYFIIFTTFDREQVSRANVPCGRRWADRIRTSNCENAFAPSVGKLRVLVGVVCDEMVRCVMRVCACVCVNASRAADATASGQ